MTRKDTDKECLYGQIEVANDTKGGTKKSTSSLDTDGFIGDDHDLI